MTESPLLTICVLTYNNEKTIKETMESILGQTYSNFEVLVSDNGSSDKTLQIVDSFKNPKISVRKNIKTSKTGKWYVDGYDNYNGCIWSGMIKGEFVSFYHSDDIYQKDIARKEVEFLVNHPDIGAVFTLGKMINQNGQIIREYKIPKELKNQNTYDFQEIFKNILKYGNIFLITPTLMARKSIFGKVGPMQGEEFETAADLEMWLRLLKNYNIGILKENLIYRRIGGSSTSYILTRTKEGDYFKVMDFYLKSESPVMNIEKKYLRQYAYHKYFDKSLLAINFLAQGNVIEAKKLVNHPPSLDVVRAFFEHNNARSVKVLLLGIVLFFGINTGTGKLIGKILRKIK